jgi:hypothetical protein
MSQQPRPGRSPLDRLEEAAPSPVARWHVGRMISGEDDWQPVCKGRLQWLNGVTTNAADDRSYKLGPSSAAGR